MTLKKIIIILLIVIILMIVGLFEYNYYEYGNTLLHFSSYLHNTTLSKICIALGADLNAKSKISEHTPLFSAIVFGGIEEVKLLVEKGADVNLPMERNTITPLGYAAKLGRKEIAELLISKGAKENVPEGINPPLLLAACSNRKGEIAELLINKGASLNATGDVFVQDKTYQNAAGDITVRQGHYAHKMTPLMGAALKSNIVVAKVLLKKGADINLKNADGETALDIAIKKRNKEMIDLLSNAAKTKQKL